MKKKIFALGIVLSAFMLAVVFFSSSFESKAENASATTNVKALTNIVYGDCTGPKTEGDCESRNTAPCSDLSGCNSTEPVLEIK